MNTIIFSSRLQECRRRKYSSQQAFADAYMEKFGMIRKGKKNFDNNMFGTIQSWEQGKSTPTAEALANVCDLLDCDADYLLGRIDQRTHDINDAHRFTGLSVEALEQLHEYRVNLHEYPDPKIIADMESNWPAHPYYKAYALYLIDELLVGSKSFNLSVGRLDRLFTMIYEEGIGVEATDYEDDSEESTEYRLSEEERKLLADQCREEIDQLIYRLTTNIRDIIYENTVDEKLPPAVKIKTNETNNTYFFSVDD